LTDINQADWTEADASNTSTPPNGWPSATMLPSQVEPAARAIRGAIKRWYDHAGPTLTSAGTANAQTLTYSVAPAALVRGDGFSFIAGATNSAATTLNINGLGAKAVQIGSQALTGGEIQNGLVTEVGYDGTAFQLISAAGSRSASASLTPTNQSGTTSLVGVMLGLQSGVSTITPRTTGRLLVTISGNGSNTLAPNAYLVTIRYGTGTGPANGAAATGSQPNGLIGGGVVANGASIPFSTTAVISGLTIGQAYWIDLQQSALGGGTASVTGATLAVIEI